MADLTEGEVADYEALDVYRKRLLSAIPADSNDYDYARYYPPTGIEVITQEERNLIETLFRVATSWNTYVHEANRARAIIARIAGDIPNPAYYLRRTDG